MIRKKIYGLKIRPEMLRISQLYVITNNNMLGRFSTIKNLMLQQGHIFFYWLFLFIIYPKKCKAMWRFVKCFKFYHSFFFPFIDGSVGSKNICRLSSKIFVYWKAQKRWRTRTFRPFTYAISTKSAHTGILKLKKCFIYIWIMLYHEHYKWWMFI